MPTTLEELNELLSRVADANGAVNHIYAFRIVELPTREILIHSLEAYFSDFKTSNSGAKPGSDWGIRVQAIEHPDQSLRDVTRRWFYGQESSPRVHERVAEQAITDFLTSLRSVFGETSLLEVFVTPPMWYEAAWNDFAFDGGARRWLLHFGVSD